jgi:hypothetical protein
MLLYFGYSPSSAGQAKIGDFCKMISEFALEFRTAREKIEQQRLKKEKQRERNKTRGKLIVRIILCFEKRF